MRLSEMSQAFIDGKPKRGLAMTVEKTDPDTTQLVTNSGKTIAVITDRQPDGGYRLTVYGYNTIWWRNRVTSVLKEASRRPGDTSINRYWHTNQRYSAMSCWGSSYIWDNKTRSFLGWAEPVTFTVDGEHNVLLDYTILENSWRKDDTGVAKINAVKTVEVSNISPDTKTAINEILTLTSEL